VCSLHTPTLDTFCWADLAFVYKLSAPKSGVVFTSHQATKNKIRGDTSNPSNGPHCEFLPTPIHLLGNAAMKIYSWLLSLILISILSIMINAQDARRRSAIDYYNRANEWQKQGRLDQALTDYGLALIFDAKLAEAWNNRGVVHYLRSEYAAAIADCSKALELKPDYAEAWNNRGNARMDNGELEAAITDFDQAVKLNTRYAAAYHSRGTARHAQRQWEAAIQDYTRTLELQPQFAVAWQNRAVARKDKGDLTAALNDFTQAIKLNPRLARAWAQRGLTREKLGTGCEAEHDFVESLRLDPALQPSLEAHLNMARQRCAGGR
jgi:tetratricopeptide (TPR) repeat protein